MQVRGALGARALEGLTPEQRAELRTTDTRELESELEWVGTSVAELEERIQTADEDEQSKLACHGIMLERRGQILVAELSRRQRYGARLGRPLFDRQYVADIKRAIPLHELIVSMHGGTQLKRVGNHYEGLCPYHAENTASLHVWDDHYHCFGCGEHGDVFDWLLKRAVGSWREAVEYAAKWARLPLPRGDRHVPIWDRYAD